MTVVVKMRHEADALLHTFENIDKIIVEEGTLLLQRDVRSTKVIIAAFGADAWASACSHDA